MDNKTKPTENVEQEVAVEGAAVNPDTHTFNKEENLDAMVSGFFSTMFPRYNKIVDKLSQNALLRLNKKLVSFPLNDKAYKSSSKLEEEAFLIGRRLMEANFVLIMNTMNNSNEIHSAINDALDNESQNTNNEGEKNG